MADQVDRAGHVGEQLRVAVRVAGDERAEPRVGGSRRPSPRAACTPRSGSRRGCRRAGRSGPRSRCCRRPMRVGGASTRRAARRPSPTWGCSCTPTLNRAIGSLRRQLRRDRSAWGTLPERMFITNHVLAGAIAGTASAGAGPCSRSASASRPRRHGHDSALGRPVLGTRRLLSRWPSATACSGSARSRWSLRPACRRGPRSSPGMRGRRDARRGQAVRVLLRVQPVAALARPSSTSGSSASRPRGSGSRW